MRIGGILVLAILGLGMVGLIIGMTVNTAVGRVPPVQEQSFGEGGSNGHFQQHICTCNDKDALLATNERELSNLAWNQVESAPDPRHLSSMAAFWGQFMDHDIVLSQSDPSLGLYQIQMTPYNAILNLTRNAFRFQGQCRESVNVNTPAIDASTVYGDYFKPTLINELRDGASCKLRTSPGNLLPLVPGKNQFLAGDERNTEHSMLASLHTVWMREHNRLCDQMPASFTEEQKFWKARQVVIAKIQHITYTEWLPALFGSQAHLLSSVPMRGEDMRIGMELSVAAFRFGHSMIPDPIGSFTLQSLFLNAQLLIDNGVEPFLSAALNTPAESVDGKVVDGLRNFLFSAGPNVIGEDLITRNLFRERDMGVATYTQAAECFGLSPNPHSIDDDGLLLGLVLEPRVPGSSLPRTIAHIVAEQFRRLKERDSKYYTKIAAEIGSTFYQEVRQTTLSSVIRQNTGLETISENVFFL